MARLGVFQRGNLVDSLTTTLATCADKVGVGFRLLTEPFLQPGEQVPDMALAVQLLGRMIVDRFQTLLRHDHVDFDERANDLVPREQLNELSQSVHSKLVEYRRLADLAFGKAYSLTLVPILGATATIPMKVYRQAAHTLERLEIGQENPPEILVPGLEADLSKWTEDLRELTTELGQALGVLKMERAKASATAEEKQVSQRELDFYYSHVYSVVRGLLFLAGLKKSAQELPTLGRSRRSLRGPSLDAPRLEAGGTTEPPDSVEVPVSDEEASPESESAEDSVGAL